MVGLYHKKADRQHKKNDFITEFISEHKNLVHIVGGFKKYNI